MKPRITIEINSTGELEILINESGRDLLVKELKCLSKNNDHFHLGPENCGGEVPTQIIPYSEGDKVMEWAKVLYRPDVWDKEHFPHVLAISNPDDVPE